MRLSHFLSNFSRLLFDRHLSNGHLSIKRRFLPKLCAIHQQSFVKHQLRFLSTVDPKTDAATMKKSTPQNDPNARVTVTFITPDGQKHKVLAKVGDTLLDVVVNHQVPLDGYGACEGTLACSTCHVVLKKEDYVKLPDKPSDEEMDMLDLAYGLTDTSRLGCQIVLTKELDGLEVIVPAGTYDARSS